MVKHNKDTLRRKSLMKYARTRIGKPIVRERVKVVNDDLAIHVDLTSIDSEEIVETTSKEQRDFNHGIWIHLPLPWIHDL